MQYTAKYYAEKMGLKIETARKRVDVIRKSGDMDDHFEMVNGKWTFDSDVLARLESMATAVTIVETPTSEMMALREENSSLKDTIIKQSELIQKLNEEKMARYQLDDSSLRQEIDDLKVRIERLEKRTPRFGWKIN